MSAEPQIQTPRYFHGKPPWAREAGANTEGDDIRVMIVDDHPVVRIGVAAVLGSHSGFRVVATASNGNEALAILARVQPNIVLVDLRMPQMSGIPLIRAIHRRANAPGMIVLTSFSTDEEIYQAVSAGARGYLLKSAPQEKLCKAIVSVHEGKTYYPSAIASRLAERATRSTLTTREAEVLHLVAKGLTNKEIGRVLEISDHTARNHVCSIIQKLDVTDRTEAVTIAIHQGLVSESE